MSQHTKILSKTPYGVIPFDYKKALFIPGYDVFTIGGSPVKLSGFNENAKPFHALTGWVDTCAEHWDVNGKYTGHDSYMDLMLIKKIDD